MVLKMPYTPTPDDVRCTKCQEWYHKALRACPMCDTPNPRPVGPPVAHEPSISYQALTPPQSPWTRFWRWAELNPQQAGWAVLGPLAAFVVVFAMIHPTDDKDKREFHQTVAALVTTDKIHVRPYDPSLNASIRVVVPLYTSEREAQEIALSLQKFAHRSGVSIFFHIETEAGQRLATVGP